MKITKEWGLKFGIVLLAGLWLGLVAVSWANADEDGEYSFNWLDPEKKIYVLQNRRYLKANRVMLSGMLGVGLSNPYRTTYNFDPRLTYYFSENWGIEAFYTFTANTANSNFDALSGTQTNIKPVVREIRSQMGIAAQWVPWYAKINVFNKILYFDWYFNAGVGSIASSVYNSTSDGSIARVIATEVQQNNFAIYWGTGHLFHLNDNLLVRLDFTGAVYNAPIFGTGGSSTWYSNLNFGAGVGWRL